MGVGEVGSSLRSKDKNVQPVVVWRAKMVSTAAKGNPTKQRLKSEGKGVTPRPKCMDNGESNDSIIKKSEHGVVIQEVKPSRPSHASLHKKSKGSRGPLGERTGEFNTRSNKRILDGRRENSCRRRDLRLDMSDNVNMFIRRAKLLFSMPRM